MKRNQLAAVAVALLLFGCGVLTGVLGHRYFAPPPRRPTAEEFRQRYVAEMRDKIRLTPEQVTRLEAILEETKNRVNAVRDSNRPAMDKIKDEQTAEVKAMLKPEQIPAYDAWRAERERQFREMDKRRRGFGGPLP